MPPSFLYVMYETDLETRPLQQFIRSEASKNCIECFHLLKDMSVIEDCIQSKDMKLRFLFIDVFDASVVYNHKRVKNLLHGLAWFRNMRVFVTIKDYLVFSADLRYSKIKYVLTSEDGQFAFYDPEFPEIIYRDKSILVENVNDYYNYNA